MALAGGGPCSQNRGVTEGVAHERAVVLPGARNGSGVDSRENGVERSFVGQLDLERAQTNGACRRRRRRPRCARC